MGKFIGIDEILQGGTPNRPTHSTPKEGKKGEALAKPHWSIRWNCTAR
ncbi:hypothetical protein NXW48_09550 [Phocaeicola vulgatus]|nr:hypothetical protein [Phocaeicola vulgatus]